VNPTPPSPIDPITPLPVPAETLKAGAELILVGGTFDPPHAAHVALAQFARDTATFPDRPLPWLVFVPAARSPHKSASPIASDADRVSMVRIALEGVPNACVWTDEIDRAARDPADSPGGGGSFTVDTLRRARAWVAATHPSAIPLRLHLVLGADQAVALHRWREPGAILSLAHPLVLARADWSNPASLRTALLATGAWPPESIDRLAERVVPAPLRPESSTAIRQRLAAGEHAETLAADGWLSPALARFIEQRGLYRPASGTI
jgi:nicotinate-nucleotide adenylyltransferase